MIQRPDWSADSLLTPNNEHPYLVPVVIYKLLLEAFGMGSTLPFRVVNVAFAVLVALLVRILVRRRLGPWPGLIAAALVLFMGAAWEDLLWPVGMGFLGSTAAGLGAFLLLDREKPPRDPLVCGLLVASMCFSSLGLVFTAGVAADVLLRARRNGGGAGLARAWICAVPVALFVLWYAGYGHEARNAVSLDNLLEIPLYVWNSASSAFASVLGLVVVDPDHSGAVISEGWGKPLLIAGLIAIGATLARDPARASRQFWVVAVTMLAFWGSAGLNAMPGREPGASRYQLIGGVLIILLAAELMRGRRPGRGALVAAGMVAALAVVSGIGGLRNGEQVLREVDEVTRAELAAVEIAGDQANQTLKLDEGLAGTRFVDTITIGPYLDAVEKWGSPVDSPADLVTTTEANRARADFVLLAALQAGLDPAGAADFDPSSCRPARPRVPYALPPEGALIDPGRAEVSVRLRRFASLTSTPALGEARRPVLLRMPADESEIPWLFLLGRGPADVCEPG